MMTEFEQKALVELGAIKLAVFLVFIATCGSCVVGCLK